MTEQELIDKGYNRYKPGPFDDDCVTDCYQKAVYKDQESSQRKYFITWKKWDFSRYANATHPYLKNLAFEGDTQLTLKNNGEVIDITFCSGWEVDAAEKFMEDLFATGWFEKYDRDYEEDE